MWLKAMTSAVTHFSKAVFPFPGVITVAMEFCSAPLGDCSYSYLYMCLNDLMKCIQTFIVMISDLLIVHSMLA